MKRHRVHLSGPMIGLPNRNAEAFEAAERLVRALGHDVWNPINISAQTDDRILLLQNLVFICEAATAQVLLPGHECWPNSLAEVATARALGLPQYGQRDDEFWLLKEAGHCQMRLGPAPELTLVGDN